MGTLVASGPTTYSRIVPMRYRSRSRPPVGDRPAALSPSGIVTHRSRRQPVPTRSDPRASCSGGSLGAPRPVEDVVGDVELPTADPRDRLGRLEELGHPAHGARGAITLAGVSGDLEEGAVGACSGRTAGPSATTSPARTSGARCSRPPARTRSRSTPTAQPPGPTRSRSDPGRDRGTAASQPTFGWDAGPRDRAPAPPRGDAARNAELSTFSDSVSSSVQ